MDTQEVGATAAERRAHVAALIARYPNLAPEELEQVHHWFRKDASALEVGMLASEPDIFAQYQAYRAEHCDRYTLGDFVRAALFIAVIVGLGGLLVWFL